MSHQKWLCSYCPHLSVHHPQGEQHLEGGCVWGQSSSLAQDPGLDMPLVTRPLQLQPGGDISVWRKQLNSEWMWETNLSQAPHTSPTLSNRRTHSQCWWSRRRTGSGRWRWSAWWGAPRTSERNSPQSLSSRGENFYLSVLTSLLPLRFDYNWTELTIIFVASHKITLADKFAYPVRESLLCCCRMSSTVYNSQCVSDNQ